MYCPAYCGQGSTYSWASCSVQSSRRRTSGAKSRAFASDATLLQREHSFAVGVGLAVAAASTTRPPLTGCDTGNIAIERTAAISIVFGALTDPRTNSISVADR